MCTLPRLMGGLGLVDLITLVKVKRVQWVIRTLQDRQGKSCSKLIESYLRYLDNRFGVKFFSLKVTDSSDMIRSQNIPMFYKECINCFQELCKKGKFDKGKDQIIWSNDSFLFKGKPLNYTHWSKCGIVTRSQLYKDGEIDVVGINTRLKQKAGFVFELEIIRKVLLESHTQVYEDASIINYDKEDILEYKLEVPGLGIKCLKNLSSKDIYNIFLLNQDVETKSNEYWCNKFGLVDVDWDALFTQNLTNKYIPRKCKDFNWKLFHGLINTESRLQKMKYSDGRCKICPTGDIESMDHLMTGCKYGQVLWNKLESIIQACFGPSYKLDLITIMLGLWNIDANRNELDITIINALLSMCRYHIWKVRCCIKYGHENIPQIQSVKRFQIDSKSHL